MNIMNKKYILLNKAIFFPESGILAFGDLHLGYEKMLKQTGLEIPLNQLKEDKEQIKKIINKIKEKNLKLKKIVILGDIKHYFSFDKNEKFEVRDFLDYLENYIDRKKIILIKGNHEKFELDSRKYRDYYIQDNIVFLHGNKIFPEIFDKKIEIIVSCHLHPAVNIVDKQKIKREKYKCYLTGKYKNKEIIFLPSFFALKQGTAINKEYENIEKFSIVPGKFLSKFNVYVLDKKGKIYEFGKLKNLNRLFYIFT